jgi:RimJ/RimL family protein N-acetyltransferase
MWVAPEARGQHAATILCDACAAWAAEQRCAQLMLTVVVGNHRARRAFEVAGFAVCGETTRSYDGRTLDEVVMVRSL